MTLLSGPRNLMLRGLESNQRELGYEPSDWPLVYRAVLKTNCFIKSI